MHSNRIGLEFGPGMMQEGVDVTAELTCPTQTRHTQHDIHGIAIYLIESDYSLNQI